MPPSRTYDLATRHQLALDPGSLTTISATIAAMSRAIEDCRGAGVAPDSDPAVVLLARHMAIVSANRAPRSILRQACQGRLRDLARSPALLAMAASGVAYDSIGKDRFHSEGRAALTALADAMALKPGTYAITTLVGDRSDSGCLRLEMPAFILLLRIGGIHQHREVLYRAVRAGREIAPNYHAPMRALLAPQLFAERLRQHLAAAIEPTNPVAVSPPKQTAQAA